MRYILDDRGYVKYCSNNYITCENKTCTPYEGTIPEGYETIEEWVQNANIRAYKVVDGNLVFDEEEDARLQEEYKNCGIAGEHILFNDDSGTDEMITLKDYASNYKYIEIYFGKPSNDINFYNYSKIYNPNGKTLTLNLSYGFTDGGIQIQSLVVVISGINILRGVGSGTNIYNNSYETWESNEIKIFRVVGYK